MDGHAYPLVQVDGVFSRDDVFEGAAAGGRFAGFLGFGGHGLWELERETDGRLGGLWAYLR